MSTTAAPATTSELHLRGGERLEDKQELTAANRGDKGDDDEDDKSE